MKMVVDGTKQKDAYKRLDAVEELISML